jgi:hypothetical protein
MSKPIAVLISDVHYSLSTYKIADQAFRAAIDKAAELRVPLIDAGDLTNDKAILRAEVVNTLIDTMNYAAYKKVHVFCLVGNHSLLNEKGSEHALHFLEPYATVIAHPVKDLGLLPLGNGTLNFIPYQQSAERFLQCIREFKAGSIVIGHQGTIGGDMGHYMKDPSAIDPHDICGYTVFLGHYHSHYSNGTTLSIGNPYTLTFAEAASGPKGFLVLYADGTFTRELLPNLRKHVKLERTMETLYDPVDNVRPGDLVWLKLSANYSQLAALNKTEIGTRLFGHSNFKFDKVCTENEGAGARAKTGAMTDSQVLDMVIDNTDDSKEYKTKLKALWREIL